MKKFFILIILLSFLPSYGAVLNAGIEYSIEDVRKELYDSPKVLDANLVKTHFIDKNNFENLSSLLKGQTELKDRSLAIFSDSSYGINYKDNPLYIWYYSCEGLLMNIEIKTNLDYPYKTYKYSLNGKLVNMSVHTNPEESFVFSPQKKLLAHWKGANCFDENNNLIMTRKILK